MRAILSAEKNPALKKKARDIEPKDIGSARIKKLIGEMKALLAKEEYGVALAAPQVGESIKLFVVSGRALARDTRNAPDEPKHAEATPRHTEGPRPGEEEPRPLPDQVYINPSLVKLSKKKTEKHEGCLSIRGKWGSVPRSDKATLRAYDEHGKKFTRGASGFLAHIFQHEMDHLDGVLYTEKATHLYDEKTDKEK